jgi:hypothetical protein
VSGRVEAVSLEEIVRRSRSVVTARAADPAIRVETIEIGPGHPPFDWNHFRFRVEEVLLAGEPAPRPGETIEVSEADAEYNLGMHRKRHLEGVNKIALFHRYTPEDPENPLKLLFLARGRDGWRFTADEGAEGIRLRSQVETLLSGRSGR